MNILWLSPGDRGRAVAQCFAEDGHEVHYATAHDPRVWGHWLDVVDLIVCDEEFPSRRTRRSWAPSDASLALQRRPGSTTPYIGPLPTTELLAHDARYFAKVCKRLGVECRAGVEPASPVSQTGGSPLALRHALKDPDGQWVGPPLPDRAAPLDRFLDNLGLRSYRWFRFTDEGMISLRCGFFFERYGSE